MSKNKTDELKKKVDKKILGLVLTVILVVVCVGSIKYDEQKQKREYAIKYVESYNYSKQRTSEHMQSKGYDSELIQYAMENADVDWNKNALICAKDLIEMGVIENEEELYVSLLDSLFEEKEIKYAIDNLNKKEWEKGNKKYQEEEQQEQEEPEQKLQEEKEMTIEAKLEVVAEMSGLNKGTDYKIESDKNTIFFLLYAPDGVNKSMKNEARKLSVKFKNLVDDDTRIIVSYVNGQKIIYSAFDGKDL